MTKTPKEPTGRYLMLSIVLLSGIIFPISSTIAEANVIMPTDFNKAIKYSVNVLAGGAMQINVGTETFIIDSLFGETTGSGKTAAITYHSFGTSTEATSWNVSVMKQSPEITVITASASAYNITRTITKRSARIDVSDTINLSTSSLTAIPFKNRLLLDGKNVRELHLGERTNYDPGGVCAAGNTGNPTIYVRTTGARIGLVPQDDVYRVHVSMKNYALPTTANCPVETPATVEMNDEFFGLDNNRSYTLSWSIYPMPGNFSYWDFMNRARHDLGNIFTVEGTTLQVSMGDKAIPWENMSAEELGEFLRRQGAKYIITASPDMTGEPVNRDGILTAKHALGTAFLEDFTQKSSQSLRDLIKKFHEAEPSIQILMFLNPSASTGINDLARFEGEAVIGNDGRPATIVAQPYTHYFIGTDANKFGKIQIAQIDKVFKDYGADGVYYDQSSGVPSPRYNYNGSWDGYSLQINPKTGAVIKKIANNQLLMQPRLIQLISYIRGFGGAIIMNNPPYTQTLADQDVQQFTETGNYQNIWTSLLTQPIAYAKNKPKHDPNPAFDFGEDPMKNIVMNVRHGAMTYLSNTPFASDIQNPPSARLFPMTLLESHRGYLIGKERIVTAVSGNFSWNSKEAIAIFTYDSRGNQISKDVKRNDGQGPTIAEVAVPKDGLAILVRSAPIASCALSLDPSAESGQVKLSWSATDVTSLSINSSGSMNFILGSYNGTEIVTRATSPHRVIVTGPSGIESCYVRVFDFGKTFKLTPEANQIVDPDGHLSITLTSIDSEQQTAYATLKYTTCRNSDCSMLSTATHETSLSVNELATYHDYGIKLQMIATSSAHFKVRNLVQIGAPIEDEDD